MIKRRLLIRIALAMLAGLAGGVAVNEVTFAFLRQEVRPPETIELVIPPGTAEMVKRGEQPPSIPAALTFVTGDVLRIRNLDSTDHTLGSLWIPAGSQASLALDTAGRFTDACSFQPASFLDFDVREPLTAWTRLRGILMAGIPLGILLALYAVVAWPLEPKTPHA